MTKIVSVEKQEKDGVTVWRRVLKDEIWGKINQVLIINPSREVSLRSWMDRHYWETTLRRVQLAEPVRVGDREVGVVLEYTRGHEGEGNNHWRTVTLVFRDENHVDALLSRIVDFDTYERTITCMRDACKEISYFYTVVCDVSACL